MEEESLEELGVVVSVGREPTHMEFYFQVADNVDVVVGEFIEVVCEKGAIVGKISEVLAHNEYFSNPRFVADQLINNMGIHSRFSMKFGRWRLAHVNVLGILSKDGLIPPCIPPEPGSRVFRAKKETISKALNTSRRGLKLGTLWGREDVELSLEAKTLAFHHVVVLGATGSGKSHFCGVLIEELLEKGYPVLIVDPHGEYSGLARPSIMNAKLRRMRMSPKGYKVIEYVPSKNPRPGQRSLTIRLTDMRAEALSEICSMSGVQEDLLYLAYKRVLEGSGDVFLSDLYASIERVAREYGFLHSTILAIRRRLAVLEEMGILGRGFQPRELVQSATATILNLSRDLEERARRVIVAVILEKLFEARKRHEIPPFVVVVDEGHRFAPQGEDTYSRRVLRTIAREGRKFGLGLCIVSQRVVGLDKDIFSQCGTKVIFKLDCATDLSFIQPLLEMTSKEELQRLPLLPKGVAVISSICLRFPLLVKVRPRRSGGKGGVSFL